MEVCRVPGSGCGHRTYEKRLEKWIAERIDQDTSPPQDPISQNDQTKEASSFSISNQEVRKKKKGKEESLFAIATKEGCDTLVQRAHLSKNNHFRSLILGGVDLIAKEGEYHGSCRVQFMHETERHDHKVATSHDLHKIAFSSLSTFVQMEIIQNGKVLFMSSLLELYKAEYSGSGGDPKEVVTYNSQNLSRKFQLLSSSSFKNELGKFLLREWQKDHYWSLLNGKTLYASHGGVCYKYTPNEHQQIHVSSPAHLQANHEKADTLIAFYLENITSNAVIIRASDTDVLDAAGRYLYLFTCIGEVDGDVNIEVASEFVCKMYSQPKVRSVDEARYNKLMQMTGKIDQDKPLTNIKRIDCALLPPSRRALDKKLQRAQYVSILWNHANLACPDQGLSNTDYGWSANGNLLQPVWFDGPALPDALFTDRDNNKDDSNDACSDSDETTIVESTEDVDSDADDHIYHEPSDDEAWSEDSDTDSQDVE
ncbi:hypothetical protein Pcinc_012197 [Petrolisthes cinctipes]|uniref:Uncharacterized protein n=1 Tax=Petrolisthes cinctipes TaxID=88211 RepID=A0AAE1FZD6_PETCI|nr:hypothetical protein Pcinc_012197 [Petrolisthes cinctipes]